MGQKNRTAANSAASNPVRTRMANNGLENDDPASVIEGVASPSGEEGDGGAGGCDEALVGLLSPYFSLTPIAFWPSVQIAHFL